MRTTVRLDDDVAAAAEQLRREKHISLSQAVNELARAGTEAKPRRKPFKQRTEHMGEALIDISNVAEALEALDGPFYK